MEDGETESEEPVKVLETQGTFDEVMVWGHEILPAADDTFVKGVEEWVRFAEMVGASKQIDGIKTNFIGRYTGRLRQR
jgi:ribonuclease H2 subunit C